ncbi:MAG: hypothetical protein NZ527_02250 [Hydrogenobacter thermophilus]|uniref:hypothetical protein n=1 Tax=Hydrogenobacter thermophilus TaxID=940 RepID=UPI001C77248F|nr:hypothetical protein [Hydrogenobacter thermophilus]MCS7284515.1 hypothetical protein [Hydrogenobacter thermophilus]QWK19829.1 MAG: hypothetical protein KNN13_00395 [Hydrogenobacter thermophilus]
MIYYDAKRLVEEVQNLELTEREAYQLIGMGLSKRGKVRTLAAEEEGESFWEEHKCTIMKVFCEELEKSNDVEQSLVDVVIFVLQVLKVTIHVVLGIIALLIRIGLQVVCEIYKEECRKGGVS